MYVPQKQQLALKNPGWGDDPFSFWVGRPFQGRLLLVSGRANVVLFRGVRFFPHLPPCTRTQQISPLVVPE